MQENPGCVVTRYEFSTLFSKAWYKAIQPQNLIAGFTKSGIYPYNPEAIKVPVYPMDLPNDDDEGGDSEQEMEEANAGTHDNGENDSHTVDNGGIDTINMDSGEKNIFRELYLPSLLNR